MAGISAIRDARSALPAIHAVQLRARLQQAVQDAEQAQAHATELRQLADQADREAQQGQTNVRSLSSRVRQADSTYSAPQTERTPEVPLKTQDFLLRMYSATSQKFAASGNPLKTNNGAAPVINVQGQATGQILDLAA